MMNGCENVQVAEEKTVSDSFYVISSPVFPPMVKCIEDFRLDRFLEKTSSHEISKYDYVSDTEITGYYFKKSKVVNDGSLLEAISARFSALVSPNHAATMYVAYDHLCHYVGVLSREIPDFKPASEEKLRESDLEPSPLDNVSIADLENLYEEYLAIDNEIKHLDRRKKRIDLFLSENENRVTHFSEKDSLEELDAKGEQYAREKNENNHSRVEAKLRLLEFYRNMKSRYSITEDHFDSYRALKGHAIACVSAILSQNADFHRNNLSRYGVQVDYGMTIWSKFCEYHDNPIDIFFRSTNEEVFHVSHNDIVSFPNLNDAHPFYWPTRRLPIVSATFVEQVSSHFDFSANAYPLEDTFLHQKLQNNRIFIYHKYVTFFRYLLTTPEMYKKIISQYIFIDGHVEKLVEAILRTQVNLYNHIQNVIVNVYDFQVFFRENGESELEKFLKDLTRHGMFDPDFMKVAFLSARKRFDHFSSLLGTNLSLEELDAMAELPIEEEFDKSPLGDEKKTGFEEGILRLPVNRKVLYFNDVKKLTIEGMESYRSAFINTATVFFKFSRRRHYALAGEIIEYCNKLNPDPKSQDESIQASAVLYQYLIKVRSPLKQSGLMYDTLTESINQIENSFEFIKKKQRNVFISSSQIIEAHLQERMMPHEHVIPARQSY